jgi:uncharacterized membrane protein YphA (DoxX/SURF4 family)
MIAIITRVLCNFFLVGRILLGWFFIFFGGRHFFRLAAMTPFVAAKGVP